MRHLFRQPERHFTMNTIQDYLQTQALCVSPDEVAISRVAVQTVMAHAKAHIENSVWQHNKLPEYLCQQTAIFKQLYLALDSVYERNPVQSVVIYGYFSETNELIRFAQMGQEIENHLSVNEENAQRYLAVRTAQAGWANIVTDTQKWLAHQELLGEHHQRNRAQISLPICGENGVIYGVLHLENQQNFTQEEIAIWIGVALGVLPNMQQLLIQNV